MDIFVVVAENRRNYDSILAAVVVVLLVDSVGQREGVGTWQTYRKKNEHILCTFCN